MENADSDASYDKRSLTRGVVQGDDGGEIHGGETETSVSDEDLKETRLGAPKATELNFNYPDK